MTDSEHSTFYIISSIENLFDALYYVVMINVGDCGYMANEHAGRFIAILSTILMYTFMILFGAVIGGVYLHRANQNKFTVFQSDVITKIDEMHETMLYSMIEEEKIVRGTILEAMQNEHSLSYIERRRERRHSNFLMSVLLGDGH